MNIQSPYGIIISMKDMDLDNIKKLTKVQTEFPEHMCGNKHIFTLIRQVMFMINYNVFLFHLTYFWKQYKETGKKPKMKDMGETEWLRFLNLPFFNLKKPIIRRYIQKELTEEDKAFIKSHRNHRVGMPFVKKALLARDMLNTIHKIIEINSPLTEETQKHIVHLVILLSKDFVGESVRVKDDWCYEIDKDKAKKKKGGLKKGKNAELFKEKMYEEQKEWFHERRTQRKSRYAVDFARRYYKKCKEEYEKDNTIKFPFHFTKDVEMEDDNAFAYLTRAAQKNNKKIIEEYMKN